jgi:hypothetical protein
MCSAFRPTPLSPAPSAALAANPRRLLVNGVRRPKSGGSKAAANGSNAYWKWNTAHNRRSFAEKAMYRVKQLFGGHLTLRDYDAQVGEAMAMTRALNKMTRAGMPKVYELSEQMTDRRICYLNPVYSTKPRKTSCSSIFCKNNRH